MVYGDTMINFDYYAAAQELIICFEQEGHFEDASNLRNAMEEGSTGTEIFMALRFHLSRIVAKKTLGAKLQEKATVLMIALDNALK